MFSISYEGNPLKKFTILFTYETKYFSIDPLHSRKICYSDISDLEVCTKSTEHMIWVPQIKIEELILFILEVKIYLY